MQFAMIPRVEKSCKEKDQRNMGALQFLLKTLQRDDVGGRRGMERAAFGVGRLALVFAVLAVAVGVLAFPQAAWAKSYSMPRVDMEAQVEPNGDLRVTERRTFDFDGEFTAVWWDFGRLPDGSDLVVDSVTYEDGAQGSQARAVAEVPFDFEWREEGGPGGEAFSYDEAQTTLYAFFEVEDEDLTVGLSYTITNFARVYDDVAEVYWQFVGPGWGEDSDNVSLTVSLPEQAGGETGPVEELVKAWAHGPLDGTVSIGPDQKVVFKVPHLPAGDFAEARILFPPAWLTALSEDSPARLTGRAALPRILAEEQRWADAANQQRLMAVALLGGLTAACVLLLTWALVAFLRYGREYAPDFTGEFTSQLPDARVPVAAIGRLWRWNRESADDFVASVIALGQRGLIRVDEGEYNKETPGQTPETIRSYYVTRVQDAAVAPNAVEQATLDVLFGTIAQGSPSLWLETIQLFAEENPESFDKEMKAWQKTLTADVAARGYFEPKGKRYQVIFVTLGMLSLMAGIFVPLALENLLPAAILVPTGIALVVIGNYMPRRSKEGNNLVARCKALRNWLQSLADQPIQHDLPEDYWRQCMMYAYVFGVSKQAMEALVSTRPDLFASGISAPSRRDAGDAYETMPWWCWYAGAQAHPGSSQVSLPSVGDAFSSSLSKAQSTVSAALSSSSSGGGGGGGFSGGGGGGFGGGGGGAR
ncbi:DUF2207 domain-containing protein [Eggerthellaceae bacterium zg-887]|nr:DUF2207 domain-containing protein [Xiamenia xianingshaonis]